METIAVEETIMQSGFTKKLFEH